jgi:DNA-binding NarL/FixJ family response regulator
MRPCGAGPPVLVTPKMSFSLISSIGFLVVAKVARERTAMIERLETLGAARFRETDDAIDAMEIIRSGHIDMVIADWTPKLARYIRAAYEPKVARLPFIMLHTARREGEIRCAVDAGVNEILPADATPESLLEAVLRLTPPKPSFLRETQLLARSVPDHLPPGWSLTPEEIATLLQH